MPTGISISARVASRQSIQNMAISSAISLKTFWPSATSTWLAALRIITESVRNEEMKRPEWCRCSQLRSEPVSFSNICTLRSATTRWPT